MKYKIFIDKTLFRFKNDLAEIDISKIFMISSCFILILKPFFLILKIFQSNIVNFSSSIFKSVFLTIR